MSAGRTGKMPVFRSVSLHSHQRIRIFKRRAAWSRRQVARAQRFVIAPVKIDLPSLERAAGIRDLPAGAAENCADGVVERGQLNAIHKTVFAFSSRGG